MKGSLYSLEAALAVTMIIVTLVLFFQETDRGVDLVVANYKLEIYNALEFADDIGNLREYVLDSNATGVESEISHYISSYITYDVVVYNESTNMSVIPVMDSDNIISVGYLISGNAGNFTPREVRVFIWGFD